MAFRSTLEGLVDIAVDRGGFCNYQVRENESPPVSVSPQPPSEKAQSELELGVGCSGKDTQDLSWVSRQRDRAGDYEV